MHALPRLTLVALLSAALPAFAATRTLGIPTRAGEETVAYDMNAAGQVAAVLEDEQGNRRGALFDGGRLVEIGSLGGICSDVRAINEAGVLIGSARREDGTWRAFLFDRANGMRDLGTLGGPSSHGAALNARGDAAGFADTADGEWHAFLRPAGGAMRDLGTLGGRISYASGVNDAGQVAGTSALADGYRHAFLYDAARGMVDLGTLGGRSSAATAINASGIVVGAAETADRRWHAFVHDGARMVDLGAKIGYGSSYATAINDAGHVVGTVLSGDERLSFVWRDGKMAVHRGGKGLHLTNAINEKEVVVGATFDRRLDAAAMAATARPVVTRGGSELLTLIAAVLTFTGLAVFAARKWGVKPQLR